MARARWIKPAFFKNEELSDCPYEARLLFVGLWTLADRDGYVEYRPKRIKAELFPYDDLNLSCHVITLHGKKFLGMSMVDLDGAAVPFLHIFGFRKHQRPHPHETKSVVNAKRSVPMTYEEVVTFHGEKFHYTASCAFNPLILNTFNPSILKSGEGSPGDGSGADAPSEPTETPKRRATFVKPTIDEVASYISSKGYDVDAEAFWNFYESKGWMVGKNSMKDWNAAVVTWVKSSKPKAAAQPVRPRCPTEEEIIAKWNPHLPNGGF